VRSSKYGDRSSKYGDRSSKYGDRLPKYGDRDKAPTRNLLCYKKKCGMWDTTTNGSMKRRLIRNFTSQRLNFSSFAFAIEAFSLGIASRFAGFALFG
jgi:hypothetical protein